MHHSTPHTRSSHFHHGVSISTIWQKNYAVFSIFEKQPRVSVPHKFKKKVSRLGHRMRCDEGICKTPADPSRCTSHPKPFAVLALSIAPQPGSNRRVRSKQGRGQDCALFRGGRPSLDSPKTQIRALSSSERTNESGTESGTRIRGGTRPSAKSTRSATRRRT